MAMPCSLPLPFSFLYRHQSSLRGLLVLVILLLLAGCAGRNAPETFGTELAGSEEGIASYYADRYHGRQTASGERFDQGELTAAHRTLPFGTRVRVIHLGNGRETVVRINDRGPFVRGRIIDVSQRAAEELEMRRAGTAVVRIIPVD